METAVRPFRTQIPSALYNSLWIAAAAFTSKWFAQKGPYKPVEAIFLPIARDLFKGRSAHGGEQGYWSSLRKVKEFWRLMLNCYETFHRNVRKSIR